MKLTADHLSKHLPHGLKCMVRDKRTMKVAVLNGIYSDGQCVFADLVESTKGFTDIKPILRKIDSITEHERREWGFSAISFNGCRKDEKTLKTLYFNYGSVVNFHDIQRKIKRLIQLHFDVDDLIGKGLAVDVSTLHKNPYDDELVN